MCFREKILTKHQQEEAYLKAVSFAMEQHYAEIDNEAKQEYQSTHDEIKNRVPPFSCFQLQLKGQNMSFIKTSLKTWRFNFFICIEYWGQACTTNPVGRHCGGAVAAVPASNSQLQWSHWGPTHCFWFAPCQKPAQRSGDRTADETLTENSGQRKDHFCKIYLSLMFHDLTITVPMSFNISTP